MATASKSRQAARILQALRRKEGVRNIPAGGGMTDVLLSVIVARGSSVAAARKALSAIRESVVNWNELRVTRPWEVSAFLGGIRDADEKAAAIHDVLANIFEGTHDLELSFLEGASAQEARDFLTGLGGLTAEMVSEVILSGRGFFHVSVDSDVVRVCSRLGLAKRRSSPAKCQSELEKLLGAEKAYQMVYLLKGLAESVCMPRTTKCDECALAECCNSARVSKKK